MKHKFAAVLLSLAFVGQMGIAQAQEVPEPGPLTEDHPIAWGMASLPFRVVSAAVGGVYGVLSGGVKGVVDTEKAFCEQTFGSGKVYLYPVGVVGSIVALPIGFIKGVPAEAVKKSDEAFYYWDRF